MLSVKCERLSIETAKPSNSRANIAPLHEIFGTIALNRLRGLKLFQKCPV